MFKDLFSRSNDAEQIAAQREQLANRRAISKPGRDIGLGDRVVDSISGFTGVVVCMSFWTNGCIRVTISPETTDSNKLQDNQTLDLNQLQLVEKLVFDCGFEVVGKLKSFESEAHRFFSCNFPGGNRKDAGRKEDPV